jgi:hypothetical protein
MSFASRLRAALGSPQPQTRNPAAPRPSNDAFGRFASELERLAGRAPQQMRPAVERMAKSPRAVAAGLGVIALGLGLFLVANKRTRAGAATLAGAALGLAAKSKKHRRGYGF